MRPASLILGDQHFTLRPAVEADLPALVTLLADDPIGATREGIDDLEPYRVAFRAVDADPAHLLVVAEDREGALAATLQLSLLPGLARHGATRAQIEGVRVAAGHRGAVLGSTLVRWAVDEARARGAVLVQLTTDLRREDAQRFSARLGFTGSHLGMQRDLR